MPAQTVNAPTNLTADTLIGPSNAIWGDCPWAELQANPFRGQTTWMSGGNLGTAPTSSAYAGQIGSYTGYMYQGAQINDGQLEYGSSRLGSDGDNEGLAIMESQAGKYRFVTTSTLALNRKMWFECSILKSSVATAHLEAFIGLMKPTLSSGLPAAAQPITTTDDTLMTAGDLFGFHLKGVTGTQSTTVSAGPTEASVGFVLTSGTVNYPTSLQNLMSSTGQTVLAAATTVKLGWIYDPGAATKTITLPTARQTANAKQAALIRFFVNGLEVPTFLSSSDVQNATAAQAFPTAFMTPVVAMMNQASQSSDYLGFRWLRCAQLASDF